MTDYKLTTLCYLTREDEILFMVKGNTSKNISNLNVGKYLGVGGHLESGESAFECALREIYEETGITQSELENFSLRGVATFINDACDNEIMYIYKGEYTGAREPCPGNCDEGRLTWVDKKDIYDLPIWEGDRQIFKLLFDSDITHTFEIKLCYHKDELISVESYS